MTLNYINAGLPRGHHCRRKNTFDNDKLLHKHCGVRKKSYITIVIIITNSKIAVDSSCHVLQYYLKLVLVKLIE